MRPRYSSMFCPGRSSSSRSSSMRRRIHGFRWLFHASELLGIGALSSSGPAIAASRAFAEVAARAFGLVAVGPRLLDVLPLDCGFRDHHPLLVLVVEALD